MNENKPDPTTSSAQVSGVSINTRIFHVCIIFLALISLAAFSLVYLNLKDKRKELEQTVSKRLELLAGSRVEVISTWLAGLTAQSDRIIQSDVFRLYATEIDLFEGDISVLVNSHLHQEQMGESPIAGLVEQLPMMEQLLKGFTAYSGFLSGRIVNRNGQAYISTDGAVVSLSENQKTLVDEAFSKAKPCFSALRMHSTGLVLDLFLPIFPPEGATDDAATPVAVLMLSKSVTNKLNDLLAKQPLAQEGEKTRLLQLNGSSFEEIAPWTAEGLQKIQVGFEQTDKIPFGVRPSIDDTTMVYSAGEKVPELKWWALQEADYSLTNSPLKRYKKAAITIVTLVVVALALVLGGAWWVLIGVENRKVAEKFRLLAEQIQSQHQFLESINSTVTDYIGYKDSDGTYRYVNPAFAKAVGREVNDVIGLDDRAVFGYDTGKRLSASDTVVFEKREPITSKETVYLMSTPHHLLITKIPFRAADGEIIGIVSVFTDITPLIEAQEKNERRIRQTIEAFVKTVEMTDPYLAGHSRLMSSLSGSIARELQADEETRATVELGALISQIGKVFVDRDTLTKPGQLDEDEMREVQSHVDHAASILKGMDFDLPVVDAVYQMNENLDGSGYPQGLKKSEITLSAQILAVANGFCAMIKPRSYRSALKPEKALEILEGETAKYSQEIIDALKAIIKSAEGDKLLKKVE